MLISGLGGVGGSQQPPHLIDSAFFCAEVPCGRTLLGSVFTTCSI